MKLNILNPKQVTLSAVEKTVGRLNDGGGLALLCNVKSKGGALSGQHRWVYRSTFGGKPFELGLGTLAEVSLATARELADEARKKVGAGIDPRQGKQDKRAEEAQAIEDARRAKLGLPVENSVKDWVLRHIAKQESSWASASTKIDWIGSEKQLAEGEFGGQMGKYVFPVIGNQNIRKVTRQEITNLLNAAQKEAAAHVQGSNGTETMHRLRNKLKAVFDFAMHSGYLEKNEVLGQEKVIPKKRGSNFPAVETAEALRQVLIDFDNYGGNLTTCVAMQVQAYLFQRPNITVGMKWAHVNLKRKLWTVPCADMKGDQEEKDTGAPHEIHLPRQVVKLLETLKAQAKDGAVYVFPNEKDENRPMPVSSLNEAMQFAMGKVDGQPWESYQVAHGFRSHGITFGPKHVELYGMPLVKDVMDVISGHKVGDYLGQAYMRDNFGDRRPRYCQAYADWIDAVRAGEEWAMLTVTERKEQEWEARQAANAPTIDPATWERFLAFQAAEAAAKAQQAA